MTVGNTFDRTGNDTPGSGQRNRRKTLATGKPHVRGRLIHVERSLHDVGTPLEQFRRKSDGNIHYLIIVQQGIVESFVPEIGGILAEQDTKGQTRLLDGTLILRNIGLGLIDEAHGLLKGHAVGHAVTGERIHERRRLPAQHIALPGDPQVAGVLKHGKIGGGDFRRQRQHHAPVAPFRRVESCLSRPVSAAECSEKGYFPGNRRFDRILLGRTGRLGIVSLRRDVQSHRGKKRRTGHSDIGACFEDTRSRLRQIAVVFERVLHQAIERRIPENLPPGERQRHRILRKIAREAIILRHFDLRVVEFRSARCQCGNEQNDCKVSFHDSFCFNSRLRSNLPTRATR